MIKTVQRVMFKNLTLFINILIALAVVVCATFFLQYDVYEHDDFLQSFFLTHSIKELILTADHGRYLSWFVMKTVVHGTSHLLNIHPQDNHFGAIFIGFDFALLGYLLSCVFYIDKDKKAVNPLIYLSVILLLIYFLPSSFDLLTRYTQHFGYIFNFLFFMPFILIFGKAYINQTEVPLVKGMIVAFLTGISAHFNIITSVGIFIFLALYELFNKTFKISKNLLTSVIAFSVGAMLNMFNPTFILLKNERSVSGSILQFVADNYKEFINVFLNNVIINNKFLFWFITLIILIIFLKLKNNKSSKRAIILSLSIVFGIFLFNLSLITCGKTFYDGHSFWLVHTNLKFITTLNIFTALSVLLSQISDRKYVLILLVISGLLAYNIRGEWIVNYYSSISKRRFLYQIEKTNLFYAYKNSNISYVFHNNIIENWTYYDGCQAYKRNFYLIYKVHLPEIKFIDKNEYDERIQKDGLYFSKEEMKIQKFTNLYKQSFVFEFPNR